MEASGATDLARDIPSLKKLAKLPGARPGVGLEHVRAVIRFAEAIADAQAATHGLCAGPRRRRRRGAAARRGKAPGARAARTHPLAGTMLRHAFSGVHLAALEDVPPEVMHIIAYHAAEGHRIPRTLECHIVYTADVLSVDALERRELGARRRAALHLRAGRVSEDR